MPIRDLRSILLIAVILMGTSALASAQSKPGVIDGLHTFDLTTRVVEAGKFPELSIEQLRTLTRYSHLQIKKGKLQVADGKHMRRVEPHPKDKSVLVIHGDHYRFSTLRDGRIDARKAHKNDRKYYNFLWLKYEGRKADGAAELRDLILLPYKAKTGELKGPWPFAAARRNPMGNVFISRAKMEARDRLGLPADNECVVGTFASGKSRYLVLSVPVNYEWWGKVMSLELLGARGKKDKALAAYHQRPKKKKNPGWVAVPKRFPNIQWECQVAARNPKEIPRITGAVPALLAVAAKSEPTEGWEDLLKLEIDDRPIKALDAIILEHKTLGELIAWANLYYQKNSKNGHMDDWSKPLDKAYQESPQSWVVSFRVLRYAFRRHGFPCRVVAIYQRSRPDFPYYALRVVIPSRNMSWTIGSDNENSVFEHTSVLFESFPQFSNTERGRVSTFDCDLGGEKFIFEPIPEWL